VKKDVSTDLDQVLRRATVAAPPLPDIELAGRTRVGRRSGGWPVVVIALLIVSAAFMALPLNQRVVVLPNDYTAWASVDGCVIDLMAFDNLTEWRASADSEGVVHGGPNELRLKAALRQWATECNLKFFDEEHAGRDLQLSELKAARAQADVLLRWRGGGGGTEQVMRSRKTLMIRNASAAQLKALGTMLNSLAGIAVASQRRGTFYCDDGFQFVLPVQQVAVNGRMYMAPTDFTLEEYQMLELLEYEYQGRPLFLAFWRPDLAAGTNRFKLGDVVRISRDGNSIQVTDVVKDWTITNLEREQIFGGAPLMFSIGNVAPERNCFGFELPYGVSEAEIDPLAELRKALAPGPGDTLEYSHRIRLAYQFIPDKTLVEQNASEYGVELEHSRNMVDALRTVIQEWLVNQPDYRRSPIFRSPVEVRAMEAGQGYHRVLVFAKTNAPEELGRELQALLGTLPGLPKPLVTNEPVKKSASKVR
jgi:hypothetical protein